MNTAGIEARTIWQAHDIDGITRTDRGTVGCAPGDLVQVRVESVEDDVDLTARVERVVSRAGAVPAPSRRALPLMTIGAYGR